MKHLLTFFVAIAFLGACGFQPVHTATGLAGTSASNITIPEIPGRQGHALRRALLDELAAGLPGVENATLTVTIDERIGRLAIRPDEAAARTDIIASGRYVLDTGNSAISGRQQADTSFNVPTSAFGDISAQNAARDQVMILLAQRIADDLKLKLKEAE